MLTHGLARIKDLQNSDSFTNSLGSPRMSFHAPKKQKLLFFQVWGEKEKGNELTEGQPQQAMGTLHPQMFIHGPQE